MKLVELAFACYIYDRMTDFNRSYHKFLEKTKPQLDISIDDHRLALLKWLNDWGCRQFYRDFHKQASEEIYK